MTIGRRDLMLGGLGAGLAVAFLQGHMARAQPLHAVAQPHQVFAEHHAAQKGDLAGDVRDPRPAGGEVQLAAGHLAGDLELALLRVVERERLERPAQADPDVGRHAGDDAALAAALLRLFSMPEPNRTTIGRRGRDWVLGHFNAEIVAEQTLRLYGEIARSAITAAPAASAGQI